MEYSVLGTTGIEISQLSLGTMTFGSEADEQMSAEIFYRCRDAGINAFDTANIYGAGRDGRSEEILGKLIRGCRDELIISTKAGSPRGRGVNDGGLSRRYLMLEVEKSLRRLGTDRIDLYYIHTVDPSTPMEETLRALDDLQRQGKILYPAVSNHAAWQIALSLGISRKEGLAPFACIQPMYNLVKRQAEVEILELAAAQQMGVISYSPLGGGLLTGKYAGTEASSGRIRENERYKSRYRDPACFDVADRFAAYARTCGVKPATLAVAWVMSHPAVTSPLIGARNLEQLEDSLAAVDISMRPEWRDEISALSASPAPATDRSEQV